MARFNLKRLGAADRLVVVAGAVALVALFLPWWGLEVSSLGPTPVGATVSGWGSAYGWLGDVLMVGAAAYLVSVRSEATLPRLPLGPFAAVVTASGLGTVLVALRWLLLPRAGAFDVRVGYDYGPRLGIILAMAAGAVQLTAAVLVFRASGEKAPWRAGGRPPS